LTNTDEPRADRTTKEVLENDYFKLALEQQVRERTDAYLKRLGWFAAIVLAVAGYQFVSIVSDLKDQQKRLQDVETRLEEKSLDARKSALDAQNEAISARTNAADTKTNSKAAEDASKAAAKSAGAVHSTLIHAEGEAKQAKKLEDEAVQHDKELDKTEKTLIGTAQKMSDEAQRLATETGTARDEAKTAASSISAQAQLITTNATTLEQLMPAQVQLMIAKESLEILVHGKKTPCVDLTNWIRPGNNGLNLDLNQPETFHVMFRVRHIHLRPIDLYMQIVEACPGEENSAVSEKRGTSRRVFEYQKLSKDASPCLTDDDAILAKRANPDSDVTIGLSTASAKDKDPCLHRIPTTPFAFRMTFVYDPLLTYDFVVLMISPDENLLKVRPDQRTDDLYIDRGRHEVTSTDVFR
jgi:hypothetical protein